METTYYNLTNPQKSVILTDQYYKGSCINTITGTLIIEETVDFDLLGKAINLFIKSNDSLRIKFTLVNNITKQYLEQYQWQDIDMECFKDLNSLKQMEESLISEPFELFDTFLFQFIMIKFEDGHGGFSAKLHHSISDAWTMSLLINQIMEFYESLLQNKEFTLEEPKPSYLNFIESEKEYFSSNKFSKSKEFWNNQFDEDITFTYLNDAFSNSCAANRMAFSLENSEKMITFCADLKISVYSLFMSVLGIYLANIYDSNYFIIGSPVLNRSNYAEKNMTGMFISTIPFKCNFDKNMTYLDFIASISKNEFSIFRNQRYPYDILLDDIRKKYNITKNLFDVALSYQNARDNKNSQSIHYSSYWLFNGCVANNMDIHIYDMDDTGILNVFYDYKTDLFTKEDVLSLHKRFLFILEQVLSNKEMILKDIEIVTPEEKHFLLEEYNHTETTYPNDTPIYRLFEEQVEKTPNAIAISDNRNVFTYQQLNTASNHLGKLLENKGIQKGDKVCLFFNNSIELVTSIFALLKLGASYIPIDTSYPLERIQYIVNNSQSKAILSNTKHCHKLDSLSHTIFKVDFEDLEATLSCDNLGKEVTKDDLAYLIYTSGSTGNPKGVKIANQSLTNYIYWAVKQYVGREETNFPLYSSIAFDLTVTSVFTPLISGNAIYIYENENPELLLKDMIDDQHVHIIKLTPAHLVLLLDCLTLPTKVCKLIVGGDILPTELCKKIEQSFAGNVTIYNEYGPTETTVGCMIYAYHNTDEYLSVPVGIPIDNAQIYLLNEDLKLLPLNQQGQLYIGGDCLSKGYLHLEDITASRFLPNPYKKDSLLYQTGDLAKMYANGIVEYIGRTDFQVKINGYRIEIGEIQSKLQNHPSIKDCFVSVLELNKNKIICAYYVSTNNIEPQELRNYLFNQLPPYMLPKYFVKLESIPLTSNGKVNKALLPVPKASSTVLYTTPENELEETLCTVFCELLKLPKISTSINIFDYYVDSLLLIKAQTMLYTKEININTQVFYEYNTIKSLANYILQNRDKVRLLSDLSFPKVSEFAVPIASSSSYRNILLFGSTGFLGVHILYKLLVNTDFHIFCLIRSKDSKKANERFSEKFLYYFSEEELKNYGHRITIIEGNLLEEDFGLIDSLYDNLGKTVDCIVDAAAIVKHYGDYKTFEDTNVNGTKKIITFCKKYHLPFHYVSTISVSGYGLVEVPDLATFSEEDLYIGQSYKDNVYVRSKFEAELLIFNECKENNLIASIYRVGNISNRYMDGKFQENANENAFLNRLISLLKLRCIPQELLQTTLEFTPVDFCAYFITKLLTQQDYNLKIYHLFNQNLITIEDFLDMVRPLGINLHTVSLEKFNSLLLSSPQTYFGITNYMQTINSHLGNVGLLNTTTNTLLDDLGLLWPNIKLSYLEKILNYLKNTGFLGGTYEKEEE